MPDACFLFTVNAAPDRVFDAIASAAGISAWWSQETDGEPEMGKIYTLDLRTQQNQQIAFVALVVLGNSAS